MTSALLYRLRGFYPGDPEEIERMNLMYYHPGVMKAKSYWQSEGHTIKDADLSAIHRSAFSVPTKIMRQNRSVSYAVADIRDRLVGWVWFYHDSRHPLPTRLIKELKLTSRNSRVYQVSYEKLLSDGWPPVLIRKVRHITGAELRRERRGVIVEGLRLALGRLRREYRALYPERRMLVLYAYVLLDNYASQVVLERNGFWKDARVYRHAGEPHELWVRVV